LFKNLEKKPEKYQINYQKIFEKYGKIKKKQKIPVKLSKNC
jgi:hypothetical protein